MTLYDQARLDLDSQVGKIIAQGDTALSLSAWPTAVQAYQKAGAAGAQTVGPEIDAVGYPDVTQPMTQQAWTINGKLAALTSAGAAQADALSAQALADNMLMLYASAVAAGEKRERDDARREEDKKDFFSAPRLAFIVGSAVAGGVLMHVAATWWRRRR